MIVRVRVIPKSSRKLVTKEGEAYKVHLTKPAHDGLANAELIELLADHFHIKKYSIKIIKGLKSKDKLVEINA